MWCFGVVQNTLSVPITQVIVRVYLVNADGNALVNQSVFIAQRVLMPNERSPYGVLFDSIPDGMAGGVATLDSADQTTADAVISVQSLNFKLDSTPYQITGQLVSAESKPLREIALIATAYDANEHVTGYREFQLPATQTLLNGQSLPFEFSLTPQGPGTMRIEVGAQAIAG
jgi:hypothetical protein